MHVPYQLIHISYCSNLSYQTLVHTLAKYRQNVIGISVGSNTLSFIASSDIARSDINVTMRSMIFIKTSKIHTYVLILQISVLTLTLLEKGKKYTINYIKYVH
jgi:hypothetical protein